MRIYQTTHHLSGTSACHTTLELAHAATGWGHVEGPDGGPEPGAPWEVYASAEAYAAGWPAVARIDAVDVPPN